MTEQPAKQNEHGMCHRSGQALGLWGEAMACSRGGAYYGSDLVWEFRCTGEDMIDGPAAACRIHC